MGETKGVFAAEWMTENPGTQLTGTKIMALCLLNDYRKLSSSP